MVWASWRNDWWRNLPPKPTIVEKVIKELKKLGIEGDIQYKDYKWKMSFQTQEDMNLYKLIGRYRKDRRFTMVIIRD